MKKVLLMNLRKLAVSFAFVLGVGVVGSGCPGCPNPPTVTGVLNCLSPAVKDYGIPLIPKVNNCLTGVVDWKGCLIGLISPAAGITEEVLACVTRDQGGKFASTADDPLENKAACRADAFIMAQKYEFKDGYQRPENVDTNACGQ